MEDLFTIDAAPDAKIQKRIRKRAVKKKSVKPPAEKLERTLARAVFGSADDCIEDDEDSVLSHSKEPIEADSDFDEEQEGYLNGGADVDEDVDEDADEDDAAKDVRSSARRRGGEGKQAKSADTVRQAAWVDDDDEAQQMAVASGPARLRKLRKTKAEYSLAGTEYVQRLRAQFVSVQPDADWAALPATRKHKRFPDADAGDGDDANGVDDAAGGEDGGSDATGADEGVMRSAASLLGKGRALPHTTLSLRRMTDLNVEEPNQSIASIVQWHPNAQLALTAGPDQTVRLFRVEGTSNHKIQAVHTAKMPISSAAFTADGAQILICGQSKHWCVFDLHAGSLQKVPGVMGRSDKAFHQILPSPDGSLLAMVTESNALLLLSAKSKQLIATLHTASAGKWSNQCIAFSPCGGYLHAAATGSKVQVWDVKRRCCVHSWSDRGGVRVTALDASPDGQSMAAGADSGAVNLYRTSDLLRSDRPEPTKEFLNLRSAITTVRFNPSSEMVAFSTKYIKSAMRVAHVGRQLVFPNWPTQKTPLNYTQTCAFSPNSGFLAAGNDKGKVLLYRLNHYDRA